MGKGAITRANLRVTRAQIQNNAASAQARAFRARQIAKQQREAEERKLRAAQAAKREREAEPAATTPADETAGGEPPGSERE